MKIEYNKLCRRCEKDCKQLASSKIIHCPQFKKKKNNDKTKN